jgi:hypothetical protein
MFSLSGMLASVTRDDCAGLRLTPQTSFGFQIGRFFGAISVTLCASEKSAFR